MIEVNLIGREVTGLGFDVKGNPREGIFISNIHERGAARDSNSIQVGECWSVVCHIHRRFLWAAINPQYLFYKGTAWLA